MYKKILVPVDGSEGAWKALATAAQMAECFGAELLVANVVQPYSGSMMTAVHMDATIISRNNQELESISSQVLSLAKEKLAGFKGKVETVMEIGHPSNKVLSLAKEEGCDLIVIGSRGLSGIAEFFLGSVSSRVVQAAEVPVVVVK